MSFLKIFAIFSFLVFSSALSFTAQAQNQLVHAEGTIVLEGVTHHVGLDYFPPEGIKTTPATLTIDSLVYEGKNAGGNMNLYRKEADAQKTTVDENSIVMINPMIVQYMKKVDYSSSKYRNRDEIKCQDEDNAFISIEDNLRVDAAGTYVVGNCLTIQ